MPAAKTFAVREFADCGSDEEVRAEEIRILGYTVLPGVLGERELGPAREKLDAIYRAQLDEVGGEEVVRRINDEHVARAPLAYDDFFLGVATRPAVLAIVGRLLTGGYFQLMLQNGIINAPAQGHDHAAGAWHRDLNYQHYVSSRPLSVSALFCIDDFSALTGGTHVLPGSHNVEAFPPDAFIERHELQIEAPAGSVIVFDSMMYHRTGVNRSAGPRRAINHTYTVPFVKQQIDLPSLLGGRHSDDPALRRLLGYESRPDPSVRDFRLKRLARLES
jgi:ectoine hydroxylase-related dioxygenase (phytanoyl-CoA dioxygenase family)